MSDRARDPDSARPPGPTRARRVAPPAGWELDAPTLDAAPPAAAIPHRPRPLANRANDEDTYTRRHGRYNDYDERVDDYDDEYDLTRRRRRRAPTGADPLGVVAVSAGGVAALTACLWPVGLTVALVAVVCGAAGLRGRSRRLAVAGLTLGVVVAVVSSGLGTIVVTVLVGASTPAPAVPVPPFFPTPP